MHDYKKPISATPERTPWNKGKLTLVNFCLAGAAACSGV
jgi:hypothetical protein